MFVQINFPKNIIIADFTYLVIDLTSSIKKIKFEKFPDFITFPILSRQKSSGGDIIG